MRIDKLLTWAVLRSWAFGGLACWIPCYCEFQPSQKSR